MIPLKELQDGGRIPPRTMTMIKKISRKRSYRFRHEIISPALEEIAKKLLNLEAKVKIKMLSDSEGNYRHQAKYILKSLKMWPIPNWMPKHLVVTNRLVDPNMGLLADYIVPGDMIKFNQSNTLNSVTAVIKTDCV